jgi:hypothetical protein
MKKYRMLRVEGSGPPIQVIESKDTAYSRAVSLAVKTRKSVHVLALEAIVAPVLPAELPITTLTISEAD